MHGNQLKKSIGLVSALSIVVGMVMGSGVFFMPTQVFSATTTPGLGIIAWMLGGFISIAAGLTTAEISAIIPKTGGMVTYLKEVYGDLWGYLLGWAQTLVFIPAIMAALAIMFSTQVISLLGLRDNMLVPIGIFVVVFLSIMNSLGSKTGGIIQTLATVGKLIPLFAIIIVGFVKGDGGVARLLPIIPESKPLATALGSALAAIMFAYDGWINVGNIAGEMKNPKRDLPIAIVGGLFVIMGVYVLINIAYLLVLPADVLASTPAPANEVANVIFGASGGKLISAGIMISIFGTLNAFVLTGARVPYVMAVENKLPFSKSLAKLNKSDMPLNSTILISVLSSLYIMTGNFGPLIDLTVFIIWIFYILIFFAIFILRKTKPDIERPYKVPMYPIIPIIAILGGLYIVVNTIIAQPTNALLSIGITILGIPVYMSRKHKFTNLD